MSNYESKLGEWLKYVQQSVEGNTDQAAPENKEQPKPEAKPEQQTRNEPDRLIMCDRLGRVISDEAAGVDPASIIADPSLIERRPEITDRRAGVFEDSDVPDVEDFLPFLKDSQPRRKELPPLEPRMPEPKTPEPTVDSVSMTPLEPINPDQGELFSEGTGEPKPIIRQPEKSPVVQPSEQAQPAIPAQPAKPLQPVRPMHPKAEAPKPTIAESVEIGEMWAKLPRHIQLLMGQASQEVAQNSYKQFKETREELIARLLDPTLSLEETARILNVCPTTVRRYTNRGVLTHIRTAGNQRRFRLSDVLAFLESQPSVIDSDIAGEMN